MQNVSIECWNITLIVYAFHATFCVGVRWLDCEKYLKKKKPEEITIYTRTKRSNLRLVVVFCNSLLPHAVLGETERWQKSIRHKVCTCRMTFTIFFYEFTLNRQNEMGICGARRRCRGRQCVRIAHQEIHSWTLTNNHLGESSFSTFLSSLAPGGWRQCQQLHFTNTADGGRRTSNRLLS